MSASESSRGVSVGTIALGLFALLALVPLAAVWRQSPDLRHGWAAALLMAYLWWERAGERPRALVGEPTARTGGWWTAGLVAASAAVTLRFLLTPYPLWPAALWSYVGLLVGFAAAVEWRRAGLAGTKWLLAPCILLVSALPWPAIFEHAVIFPLREGMASLAAEVCYWLGRPALAVGTTVRLASGWVGIDEACGGIRSLQACVMIAIFFGEWFRFTPGRRVLLLAAGVVSAMVGNFARVLFLALTAGHGGEQAVERFHDLAGWAALGLSLIVTAFLACRAAGWRMPKVVLPVAGAPVPMTAGARAWAMGVVLVLVGGELGARWWFHSGAREGADAMQWTAAFPEAHQTYVAEPLSPVAAEMLQPDAFRAGRWQESGGVSLSAYYVEWRKGQAARSIPFLHNPTVCLPLAGCELVGELGEFKVDLNGLNIPFRAYRFSRRGEEMWVAFTIWDPSRARELGRQPDHFTFSAWWGTRWADVAERRANQPAQMLTLAIIGSREDPIEGLRGRLAALLRVNR